MQVAQLVCARKAFRLLVSDSDGYIDVFDTPSVLLASNYEALGDPVFVVIPRGSQIILSTLAGDVFANIMPPEPCLR